MDELMREYAMIDEVTFSPISRTRPDSAMSLEFVERTL